LGRGGRDDATREPKKKKTPTPRASERAAQEPNNAARQRTRRARTKQPQTHHHQLTLHSINAPVVNAVTTVTAKFTKVIALIPTTFSGKITSMSAMGVSPNTLT
jgi:FtsZ-interacting cell division protein YlmF